MTAPRFFRPSALLALFTLLATGGGTAAAQGIFDDFGSHGVDAVVDAPWFSPPQNGDNGGSRVLRVRADAAGLFGQGPGNQYLAIGFERPDSGDTHNPILCAAMLDGDYGVAGQVGVRFYDPGLSDGSRNASGLLIRLSTRAGQPVNISSPFALHLYKGGIYRTQEGGMTWEPGASPVATYEPKVAHTLIVVFNNSGRQVRYASGTRTLEPGRMDVWLNGALVAAGIGKSSSHPEAELGQPLRGLAFNASPTGRTWMYIDEVRASGSITVQPSPASAPKSSVR